MSNEYVSIRVKKEVRDILKEAVTKLNKASNGPTYTIAGLVTQLADAYSTQLTDEIVNSNTTGWIANGVPIITNGEGGKHYQELLHYEPIQACFIVSNFIRAEAMERRFKNLAGVTNG